MRIYFADSELAIDQTKSFSTSKLLKPTSLPASGAFVRIGYVPAHKRFKINSIFNDEEVRKLVFRKHKTQVNWSTLTLKISRIKSK